MANNLENKKFKKDFKNQNINPAIKPATWLKGMTVKTGKNGEIDILEDKYQD